MNYIIYFWLAAIVLFAIIEALTMSLNSIWFALGALLALVAYSLNAPLYLQIIVFFVSSIVLLILTKPFVKKYLNIRDTKTNADRIIGDVALVCEKINNIEDKGQIKLNGQVWSARSENGDIIEDGAQVRVLRISGVKAYVEKI